MAFRKGINIHSVFYQLATIMKEYNHEYITVAEDNGNKMLSHYHTGAYDVHKNRWTCCNNTQRLCQGCFPIKCKRLAHNMNFTPHLWICNVTYVMFVGVSPSDLPEASHSARKTDLEVDNSGPPLSLTLLSGSKPWLSSSSSSTSSESDELSVTTGSLASSYVATSYVCIYNV